MGIAESWIESPIWLEVVATRGASYYLGLGALAVAMVWGAVLAYRSWEEAHESLDPATRDELLDAFEQAHAEGELDESELARVRRRLGEGDGGGRG